MSSMGGRQKEARPGPREPGSPGLDGGAQLAPAAASPCAERAAGEPPGAAWGGEPWRGSLLWVHPFPVSFVRVRRVPGGGVHCSAEIDGPPFCDRNHAARVLGHTFLHRREITDWLYSSRRRCRNTF